MSDAPILQVQEISKAFGGVQALSGVSFDLYRGDVFGIIGPNGSGKTTLVNCITGFVKSDSGKVLFQNKNITNKAPQTMPCKSRRNCFSGRCARTCRGKIVQV